MNRWRASLLLLLVACDDGGTGAGADAAQGGCESNEACGEGLVCLSAHCVIPQCTDDRECAAGLRCEGYRCALAADARGTPADVGRMDAGPDSAPLDAGTDVEVTDAELDMAPDGPPPCTVNDDCGPGERCEAPLCVPRCDAEAAEACGEAEVCDGETGRCVPRSGCPESCGEGLVCDEVEGRCVAAPDEGCADACPEGFVCEEEAGECVPADCEDDALAGNATAELAAEIEEGNVLDLVTCTAEDWYRLAIPPGEAGGAGLEVEAVFEEGNLDLALFATPYAVGARPLAEAATNGRPEVLRVNRLEAGDYLLRVSSWSAEPPTPEVGYTLSVVVESDGFCDEDEQCGAGRICEVSRCVGAGGCEARCPPLSECDAVMGACVERCEPDLHGGRNTRRADAALLPAGEHAALTLCDGEDDWFRIEVPEGATLSVVAEGADIGDGDDLDLELWGEAPEAPDPGEGGPDDPPEEMAIARSSVVGERVERIEFDPPEAGTYYVRVVVPRRTIYTLRISLEAVCDFDWDCCPDDAPDCPRRCDGVEGRCVDLRCGVDFECEAPAVCDPGSGACRAPGCPPDAFGGENTGREDAARIEAGIYEGLTVCDGEEDWFRFEAGADDGVRVALRFVHEPDSGQLFDLELRDDDGVLHESRSDTDDEALAYNLDAAGDYFLRVFNADAGTYALELELVGGGIDPIECDEVRRCGRGHACVAGACRAESCAGPNPSRICGAGYACDDLSGTCVCPNPDRFGQLNTTGDSAAPIEAGPLDELTICGEEEDWFRTPLAGGGTATVVVTPIGGEAAFSVNLYDDGLRWLGEGQADEAGVVRAEHQAADDSTLLIVVGHGPPYGNAAYGLSLEIEGPPPQ